MSEKRRRLSIPIAVAVAVLVAAWGVASGMSAGDAKGAAGQDKQKPKTQTVVPQKPAQEKPAVPGKAPKIYIDNKTANVGEILEQVDINYTFKVKNIGQGELQILGVRPG